MWHPLLSWLSADTNLLTLSDSRMTLRERYRRPTEGRLDRTMTKAQHMRIERREARLQRERYEREQRMSGAIIVLFEGVAGLLEGGR